jgi:adenine-specific DNA methylase
LTTIEELEERIAARKAEHADAKAEQYARDLAAYADLIEVEGPDRVIVVKCTAWAPGVPTMALFRAASPDEIKRYQDQNKEREGKVGDPIGSAKTLAVTCIKYPDRDGWKRLLELQPGMDMIGGISIVEAASGRAVKEGKS